MHRIVLFILFTSFGLAQGPTWNTQTSGTSSELKSIQMLDANTGWIVGSSGSTSGTILKTTDGGSTWTTQTTPTSFNMYSIHMVDVNTGWIVGQFSFVLKTTDGGTTWTNQSSGTSNALQSIHMLDANTGWIVGSGGAIQKTTDGGANWNSQTSGTSSALQSIHMLDASTGWISGSSGTILKTTNGGSSWSSQTSGTTSQLKSIQMLDANTGWIVGSSGTILKTTNGGSSWSSQTSGTSSALQSIHMLDASTGWIVGSGGAIQKTTDGGANWNSQTSGTSSALQSIHMLDANTGWIVGYSGKILYYADIISPTVSSVSSTVDDGTYGIGAVIPITITFDEEVIATGTPQLTLETGSTDAVVDCIGSDNTLTCNYTVAPGHISHDLNYKSISSLALNGGTIKDFSGNAAILDLPSIESSQSLSGTKNLNVVKYDLAIPIATPFFEYATDGSIEGGITKLDSASVYITASGDGIYRFDDDGNKLYKLDVAGNVKSVTTITPAHNVYIGSTDNNLYSFNTAGVSNPNWPLALGSEANASVAVDRNENVYIGTQNGIFQALSPENLILWSFNAGAPVYCSAAINRDAMLLFANAEGMLYCFDLNAIESATPSPLWYYPIGEGVKSSVALDSTYLYVTTIAGKLIKLQYLAGETGPTKVWEFVADTIITSSPIIGSNHEVYFGTHSGMIYSINADGTQKWTYNAYAPIVSTGALAEYGASMDRLFIGDSSGYAFALSLSDGTAKWIHSTGSSIISAFLYDEGVVHFGTTDGKVLKIQDTEPMNAALARGQVETTSIWGTFQGNNYRTGNLSNKGGVLSTHPEIFLPSKCALNSSYPNPFNPVTSIGYSISEISNLSLTVYDMTGREIIALYDGIQTPGYHTINWNASEQSSGIYFVKMAAGEYVNTQKLMLIK